MLAILGTGNIGRALATGLTGVGQLPAEDMILTRRKTELLDDLAQMGCQVQSDNRDAVRRADTIVVAVQPQQLDTLFAEIRPDLESERHLVISVASGATVAALQASVGPDIPVVRAMPNTAVALGESMTCLAAGSDAALERGRDLFDAVGSTLVIEEELMGPATALCACGVAFFLRAVRAASQGGIEIGFHPDEALTMAAQTALGAAALVKSFGRHPEREIDAVTTPRGCTIAGLNQMEHRGFSSAMIRGIVTSASKANSLYDKDGKGSRDAEA